MENDGNCSYHFGDLSDHRVVCLEQLKGERNDGIFRYYGQTRASAL